MQKSRSTLFLIELIIAIGFFAIAAAVCTQIFVKAHILSANTSDLNQAILYAESTAEAFRSCDGDFTSFAALFPEGHAYPAKDRRPEARDSFDSGHLDLFYDKDWINCDPSGSVYHLLVNTTDEGDIRTAQISIIKTSSDEVIYSLDVHKHPAKEVPHA